MRKLSFVDDDVEKGTRYFYRFRGLNSNGSGEWSEPVSRVQWGLINFQLAKLVGEENTNKVEITVYWSSFRGGSCLKEQQIKQVRETP